MNNKISVSNLNQIAIEWTETTQIACPVPSSFNYNLVIQDNEKNQKEDVSVQNWCNISPQLGNKQKRQLNFNKNGQSTPCNRRENNFVFKNILKSCVNYTVYVFRSEFGNTLQAEVYKNSFVIKTFEPEGKSLSKFIPFWLERYVNDDFSCWRKIFKIFVLPAFHLVDLNYNGKFSQGAEKWKTSQSQSHQKKIICLFRTLGTPVRL